VAETLCYLLNNYLTYGQLSPIDAMQKMMKKLKGQFALMAYEREMVDGGMS
jgi:glucosamine 6-phosphate synthetase-like amidotransferase/phosphosugar isomerase protein